MFRGFIFGILIYVCWHYRKSLAQGIAALGVLFTAILAIIGIGLTKPPLD